MSNASMKKLFHSLAPAAAGSALLSALLAPMANAETEIEFAGFASFAFAKTTSDEKEGDLDGISDDSEFRDFNTLGLRMDADLQDGLTFAAQLVSYGHNDYEPEFDWIFASYAITNSLSIDIGKIRAPLFMYSDYIDVSYAYQWISPPSSIYGRSYFQTIDGAKLNHYSSIGEWSSEVQLFVGQTKENFSAPSAIGSGEDEFDALWDDVAGIGWTMEREWLSLRALYMQMDVTLSNSGIQDALMYADPTDPTTGFLAIMGSVGMNQQDLQDVIEFNEDTNRYYALGMNMDFESFFITSEASKNTSEANTQAGNKDAFYVLVGTRLPGDWTLSLTYSHQEQKVNLDDVDELFQPFLNSSDPVVKGTSQGVYNGLTQYMYAAQQRTITDYIISSRWDFHPSAAFKMEYVIRESESTNLDPTHSTTTLEPSAYRIGLDLVF